MIKLYCNCLIKPSDKAESAALNSKFCKHFGVGVDLLPSTVKWSEACES